MKKLYIVLVFLYASVFSFADEIKDVAGISWGSSPEDAKSILIQKGFSESYTSCDPKSDEYFAYEDGIYEIYYFIDGHYGNQDDVSIKLDFIDKALFRAEIYFSYNSESVLNAFIKKYSMKETIKNMYYHDDRGNSIFYDKYRSKTISISNGKLYNKFSQIVRELKEKHISDELNSISDDL